MSQPTPFFGGLNNRDKTYGFYALILAFIAGVLGLGGQQPVLRIVGFCIFIPALLLTLFLYSRGRRKLAYLTFSDDSFELKTLGISQSHPDSDLVALSSVHREWYSNGKFAGYRHKGELLISRDDEFIRQPFEYKYDATSGDPYFSFFDRHHKRLTALAATNLDSSAPIPGVGWRLTSKGLFAEKNREELFLSWDQIDAFHLIDGEIRIWKKGENKACIFIDEKSLNANVLIEILQTQIQKREAAPTNQISDGELSEDSLGRSLFERKNNDFMHRSMLVIFGPLVSLFCFWVGAVFGQIHPIIGVVMGTPGVFYGFYMVFKGLFSRARFVVIHEKGVSIRQGKKETALLYSQIDKFKWREVREYYQGVLYTNTTITAKICPFKELKKRPVSIHITHSKVDDSQFRKLRDDMAQAIAERWFAQIQAEETVPWNSKIAFDPDELYCSRMKKGFLSFGPGVIPYEEIIGFHSEKGAFWLFKEGMPNSVLSLDMSMMNFYPGFFLLQKMVKQFQIDGSLANIREDGELT